MSAAAAALGLLIGVVVGGLGGGGGVLTVPVLVYLLGQNAQDATTSSLVIVGVTAAAGAVARVRPRLVDWRTGLVFGAVGIPAAYLGTLLNRHVAQPVLLLSFAGLTLLAAVAMFLNAHATGTATGGAPDRRSPHIPEDLGGPDHEPSGPTSVLTERRTTGTRHRVATAARVAACGLGVGFLTGFLGVGGGFLVVPALVIVVQMRMDLAVGTSLMIIALNAVSSLVPRLGTTALDWNVIVPFGVAAILGSIAGKRIADRLSGATLARAFAVLVAAVGVVVAVESLLAL